MRQVCGRLWSGRLIIFRVPGHFHIFVGDLSPEITSEDLRRAFSHCGPISWVFADPFLYTIRNKPLITLGHVTDVYELLCFDSKFCRACFRFFAILRLLKGRNWFWSQWRQGGPWHAYQRIERIRIRVFPEASGELCEAPGIIRAHLVILWLIFRTRKTPSRQWEDRYWAAVISGLTGPPGSRVRRNTVNCAGECYWCCHGPGFVSLFCVLDRFGNEILFPDWSKMFIYHCKCSSPHHL